MISQAPHDLVRKLVQLTVFFNVVDKAVGPLAIVGDLESMYHP